MLSGDGPVRAAEEALTRGSRRAQGLVGASASAWRVNAAAVQLLRRRRVGAGRWRARWGRGRQARARGSGSPLTRNGRRPSTAMPMPVLACPGHAIVGIGIDLTTPGSKQKAARVTVRQTSESTTLLIKIFANSKVGSTKISKKQYWPKLGFTVWRGR